MPRLYAEEIIYLAPAWRVANAIAVVIKVIGNTSRGSYFIRQTIAFVVIDPIGGIKVIWAVVEVIRAVIEVIRAIVEVVRAVFKVIGRSTKGHDLGYSRARKQSGLGNEYDGNKVFHGDPLSMK